VSFANLFFCSCGTEKKVHFNFLPAIEGASTNANAGDRDRDHDNVHSLNTRSATHLNGASLQTAEICN